MRFEKTYYPYSFSDILSYVLLLGAVFIIIMLPVGWFFGGSLMYFFEDYNTIYLLIFFVGPAWGFVYNKIGVMRITGVDDTEKIKQIVETKLGRKKFYPIYRTSNSVVYGPKSAFGRFMSRIMKNNIEVGFKGNEISIKAQKGVLTGFESEIKRKSGLLR